jgi:hypothetical protein
MPVREVSQQDLFNLFLDVDVKKAQDETVAEEKVAEDKVPCKFSIDNILFTVRKYLSVPIVIVAIILRAVETEFKVLGLNQESVSQDPLLGSFSIFARLFSMMLIISSVVSCVFSEIIIMWHNMKAPDHSMSTKWDSRAFYRAMVLHMQGRHLAEEVLKLPEEDQERFVKNHKRTLSRALVLLPDEEKVESKRPPPSLLKLFIMRREIIRLLRGNMLPKSREGQDQLFKILWSASYQRFAHYFQDEISRQQFAAELATHLENYYQKEGEREQYLEDLKQQQLLLKQVAAVLERHQQRFSKLRRRFLLPVPINEVDISWRDELLKRIESKPTQGLGQLSQLHLLYQQSLAQAQQELACCTLPEEISDEQAQAYLALAAKQRLQQELHEQNRLKHGEFAVDYQRSDKLIDFQADLAQHVAAQCAGTNESRIVKLGNAITLVHALLFATLFALFVLGSTFMAQVASFLGLPLLALAVVAFAVSLFITYFFQVPRLQQAFRAFGRRIDEWWMSQERKIPVKDILKMGFFVVVASICAPLLYVGILGAMPFLAPVAPLVLLLIACCVIANTAFFYQQAQIIASVIQQIKGKLSESKGKLAQQCFIGLGVLLGLFTVVIAAAVNLIGDMFSAGLLTQGLTAAEVFIYTVGLFSLVGNVISKLPDNIYSMMCSFAEVPKILSDFFKGAANVMQELQQQLSAHDWWSKILLFLPSLVTFTTGASLGAVACVLKFLLLYLPRLHEKSTMQKHLDIDTRIFSKIGLAPFNFSGQKTDAAYQRVPTQGESDAAEAKVDAGVGVGVKNTQAENMPKSKDLESR